HIFVADNGNNRVDEFDAWGQFVKAWGWGVRTGAPERQICTPVTGCQKGIAGAAAGQMGSAFGMTVDSSGSVYVLEAEAGIRQFGEPNIRVQKFSPAGGFL